MNIALIGYGKMGREIQEIARDRGHQIVSIIDEDNRQEIDSDAFREADVAFEFTRPESAVDNYVKAFKQNVPVVSGTTGWLEEWNTVTKQCKLNNSGFFYASNFSLGVNLFFKINSHLAKLMNSFPDYRAHIEEIHHINKLDAPSGTAISLADQILENNSKFNSWELNPYGRKDKLPVFSVREGEVTGTHSVHYVSKIDKISLRHEALSRKGFALGAVLAGEFIKGKKGIYSMNDLMEF